MNIHLVMVTIYLISAVLCLFLVPYIAAENNRDIRGFRYKKSPLRYYLTYGHILMGIGVSLVPGVNTFCAFFYLIFVSRDIMSWLNSVYVFEKRDVDNERR